MSKHKEPSGVGFPKDTSPVADDPSDVQPYRTPANVSHPESNSKPYGSPLLWFLALAGVAGVGAGSYFLTKPVADFNLNRKPVVPLREHVESFGMERMPIDEFEDVNQRQPVDTGAADVGDAAPVDSNEPVLP